MQGEDFEEVEEEVEEEIPEQEYEELVKAAKESGSEEEVPRMRTVTKKKRVPKD